MSDEQATPAASPAAPSATPADSQSAQATPQQVASPAPSPQSPTPSAEPPRERWEDILRNAREKTRREVDAEYRQRYGKYDAFEQDPWRAVQQWLDQASQHSIYGQHVQQWAQKFNQPAQVGEEPQPDVPITDAQGNITGYTYSATKLKEWNRWNQTQREREMNTRFQRLEQEAADIRDYRAQMQSQQWANHTLTEFRAKPYFREHEARIREVLEEHEEFGDNLHAAYNHVLITEILPNLSQAEQSKALNNLNQKAAGNTVTPGAPTPARPRFKTFAEAARYYAEHLDEAKAAAERG
jgi:hypothetical protein